MTQPDRHQLKQELLAELASYNPAATMKYMRHWPGGRLSMVHLNVIMLLETDGPQPMRAIADALDVTQASATGIVDRMEQRGLVERRRDEHDRRIVRVQPTEQGRNLMNGIAAERRDHLAALLDQLQDDDLAAYLKGTKAMRQARERMHEHLKTRHKEPNA